MGTEPTKESMELAKYAVDYALDSRMGRDLSVRKIAIALDAAQRAASVRVVRIVDVTKKYECCKATQLLPGQSLAVIERRAEAAAGEGKKP